jgi:hypothetical protein
MKLAESLVKSEKLKGMSLNLMIGRGAFLDRVVGRIFDPLSRNDPHILFRGDPALVIMDHLIDGVGLKTLGYLDLRLL